MRRRTRAVILAAILLAAGGGGAGAWAVFTPASAMREGPRVVEIPPRERLREVARRLADAGIIRSPWGFVVLGLVRGEGRRLHAGEYEIPRGAATPAVLALLASGAVRQHPVLHPEGASMAELARTLDAAGLARAADIERAARDPALLRTLGVEAPSLEGYLFPDTYQLVRGMAAEEILTRMVQRMRAKLGPEVLVEARARGLGVHELLTLASIVEREAVVAEERPLIAAVFWNRLRRDMPLQADPTVQYAVGRERSPLTRADLDVDHPYNTYRRPGLPPGPIASPGLAAIAATLHPAPVNYLYFVARDDRRHHFSRTLEEHNTAVARYRTARGRD